MRSALRLTVLAGLLMACASTAMAQSSLPFGRWFGRGDQDGAGQTGGSDSQPVSLRVQIVDGDSKLAKPIRAGSLLVAALAENRTTGQDILAAARGDYARVLGTLYDQGYFSAIISILLDGVEATDIAPLDAPDYIAEAVILVDPGPRFAFGIARIGPLAPETELPEDYAVGHPAGTGTIKAAGRSAITSWRKTGHAKADIANSDIIADHDRAQIESTIDLTPGPPVRFGKLHITGHQRMRLRRLRKIAGYPEGAPYSPKALEDVRKRLRRAGVFSAITLVEAETLNPDNSMDIGLTVVEQKPRRIGAGVEVSNIDGATLTAYWMHRNLLGGGERLRVDGKLSDIKSNGDAIDYKLGLRIDRPATITPDTTAYIAAEIESENEPGFDSDRISAEIGLTHLKSERLTFEGALKFDHERVRDALGVTQFRTLSLPVGFTWDQRDVPTDPKAGFWLSGEATPFLGLGEETDSGLRLTGEARAYRSFGADKQFTLAARSHLGSILGAEIARTPRDYLFYSGGGGTVRGQPYESLGVDVIPGPDGPIRSGGMSLATANAEIRYQLREKIGLVGFVDAGRVWSESAWQGDSAWHAGAGLGVRYATPIGPIRLDVASPIAGDTGSGVQLYLGLGQAF